MWQASSAYDKSHHDRLNAASFEWAEQFSNKFEAGLVHGEHPSMDQEDEPGTMVDHELPEMGQSNEVRDGPVDEILPKDPIKSKRRLPSAAAETTKKQDKVPRKAHNGQQVANDIGKDCAIAYLRSSDATSQEGVIQFEIAWENHTSDTPWWQVLDCEVAKGALSQDPQPYCGKLAEIEYTCAGEIQMLYAVFKELSEDGNSWKLECGDGSAIRAQLHLNKVTFDSGDLTAIHSWKLLEDAPVGMTDSTLDWNSSPALSNIRSSWDKASFPRYEDAKVSITCIFYFLSFSVTFSQPL